MRRTIIKVAALMGGISAVTAFLPSAPAPGLRAARANSHAAVRGAGAARPARQLRAGARLQAQPSMQAAVSYPKPTVVEATEDASCTVIWLHGLGDDGKEWSRLAEKVSVPWAKFIFPTAPYQDCEISGMDTNSWYDVAGVSVQELREDAAGINQSLNYIHSLIEQEIGSGTPSERIVVGGFSQGGCIALAAALSCPHELGGVMASSTWFPRGIVDTPSEANSKLPVMLCHGEVDPIAKVEWSRKSFDYLSRLGLPVEGNIYPEVGHEFAVMEVTDIREFIQRVTPPALKAKVAKPLGAVMTETDEGFVQVKELKEGGNAEASGMINVGDQILRINGKLVKSAGFDAIMAELVAAEGEVVLDLARPIPDRDVDFGSLTEEEQVGLGLGLRVQGLLRFRVEVQQFLCTEVAAYDICRYFGGVDGLVVDKILVFECCCPCVRPLMISADISEVWRVLSWTRSLCSSVVVLVFEY
jgi:lysophospholipase-2